MGRILGLLAAGALVAAGGAVAAEPQLTLRADPELVSFASSEARSVVLLSGSVAGARGGTDVMLESKECGTSSFVPLRKTHTNREGAFHEPHAPAVETAYRVRAGTAVSAPVTVRVRPAIRFEQEDASRYAVTTIALRFFTGARGRFERFDRASGRWALVKRVTLRRGSAPRGAGWAYSVAEFRARVRKGTLVRFVLPRDQVGPCYLAGYSLVFNTTR